MAVVKEETHVVEVELKAAYARIEEDLRKRLELVVEERNLSEDAGHFKVKFKRSIASNGEDLELHLTRISDTETKIHLRSASSVEKTVVDWGKNKRNIESVLALFGLGGYHAQKRLQDQK